MNRSGMSAFAMALGLAHAVATAAVAPEAAQDLMQKSGLWAQVDSLGAKVRVRLSHAWPAGGDAHAEAAKDRTLACASTAYGEAALHATALDAMVGALQPTDVSALLAWYGSPLGQRVVGIEQSASTQSIEPKEQLRRGKEALSAASDARKSSLQAVVSDTMGIDVAANTVIELEVAVRSAVASTDPATTAATLSNIRTEISGNRAPLVALYGGAVAPAYAFTYASLGDEDLKRYVEFLGTPAAKNYIDGSVHGVARILADGSAKLNRCVRDAAAKP